MRTLHIYLTRQILATLVMTIVVFTLVLLLGNVLREVLNLIVNGQATFGLVVRALGLLLPYVLMFALPMGMLTATLLVYGRLSADQELTAARAGGISLVSLSTPVLLLGVAGSTLSAWINLDVAPRCRDAYRELVLSVGARQVTAFVQPGRFIDDFDGFIVYVGRKSGDRLEDLLIYEMDRRERRMKRRIHAEWAEVITDAAQSALVLRLNKVSFYDFELMQPGYAEQSDEIRLSARRENRQRRVRLSDLSFFELRDRLSALEREVALSVPAPRGASAVQLQEMQKQLRQVRADLISPLRVQMHQQVAFSFACIGFTLIGVPLGVRAHRRETSAGVAMALLLLGFYYGFVILAQSLQAQPHYGPHLIVWLPNFMFQVVGAALLWRANRGL